MNFLQFSILAALPLALLPIIIHLINQNRHRTVNWAAMMFLLDAKKLTKGIARLRQILILSMRVLAVLAMVFAAARPLASGWLALGSGGKADTVIILLDRSASMEQQNLETGISKRSTALEKIADVLGKTARGSRIVLIESAGLEKTEISDPSDLLDLPTTTASDTAANIPDLLQAALDYIATDQSGRTDVWLASDLRSSDWQPGSGRWDTLRGAFSELEGVSFYLLNYPEVENDNLAVSVSNLVRRRGPEGMELIMDLDIVKQSSDKEAVTVPVELTVNGARTAETMTVNGGELRLQGHTISLGNSETKGWGRIDLPADGNNRDNTAFFVFDEAPVLKTVIVSDDPLTAGPIKAAAAAPVDSSRSYSSEIFPVSRQAEVPWDDTALLFWHAPVPKPGSPESGLLEQFVASGKSLVLLPPESVVGTDSSNDLMGLRWKPVNESADTGPFEIGWWRTDSGLLQNTRNGNPLPLGSTKIFQIREFEGETQAFLKLQDGRIVIAKHINKLPGNLYIWGTLPRSSHSSIASDGVAFFAMIHRALQLGGNYLSNAQLRDAGKGSLPAEQSWTPVSVRDGDEGSLNLELNAGAFRSEGKWLALNRPAGEDDLRILNDESLEDLFSGLDYRVIQDSINNRSSLAAEIWRVFLVAMALALIIEAALCLPQKVEEPVTAI
ncbi:MAG: BatA domain-containing protein [Verrucomicrobiales bacterium]|nr:BatA domain-containing protein [Verrucomicrobiales bacterium]